jgi:hypothetical protein
VPSLSLFGDWAEESGRGLNCGCPASGFGLFPNNQIFGKNIILKLKKKLFAKSSAFFPYFSYFNLRKKN